MDSEDQKCMFKLYVRPIDRQTGRQADRPLRACIETYLITGKSPTKEGTQGCVHAKNLG